MGEFNLLATFTGSLIAALALGYLAHRLKLSPIVGYLLAGIAVGPFTPGFVADRAVAHQLSEIGVILLLFGIGLKFELKELAAVWRVAVPGALIQSAASTLAAALLLRLLGWDWGAGIVLGLSVSVASTVVMAKVLQANRDLHSQIGHIALGWTVVEDIITVALLLALPMLFGAAPGGGAVGAFALAGLKIAALAVTVAVLGRWVIPAALEKLAATRSAELFTLAVLALALGIAAGASKIFGVSVELGAFLAGLAVGRSEFAARAGGDAIPMRDAFAVLFFVSVGMLFDVKALLRAPLTVAVILAVILAVKPLAAALTARLLGRPWPTAIPVGASFSQVGEFTFILAALAQRLGVLNDAGWNAIIAAAIISIALNPSVYAWARGLRLVRQAEGAAPSASELPPPDPNRCILVGYGPVGRTVHGLLSAAGARVTIIELNLDTVRALRAAGHDAIYGDALRPGTLEEAGAGRAGSLVLSADLEDGAEIVRRARELNPELRILARCGYLRDVNSLKKAGATLVAAGEAEVAVALAEAVKPGANARAILRQQTDIRSNLYNGG
jgi:CPA2 family monovalent cation:H+ antiporter-2